MLIINGWPLTARYGVRFSPCWAALGYYGAYVVIIIRAGTRQRYNRRAGFPGRLVQSIEGFA
jgi:hypothetical protein